MNLREALEIAYRPAKLEDGTAADLGAVPTGHKLEPGKREPHHSLDIHDDADEDDGW